MRGGGCRHGSGVLWVRGSDRWAAAGGGGHGGRCGQRHRGRRRAAKAVAAGVAGQAPPEPYVPGSGARVPAELRLVLAGYAGIACGLFAGALACAAALVFFFFFAVSTSRRTRSLRLLFFLALRGVYWGAFAGAWAGSEGCSRAPGAYPIFEAASAAQRSTHGHGDGLEAWRAHADTRHLPGTAPAAGTSRCPRFVSRCG